MLHTLPDSRGERVIELLEEFGANPEDYDIHGVAAELRQVIVEELAEQRRKEDCCRLGY